MRPFGTTIFAEMTQLAARTGAVNLGQGFPDTDGPPGMLAAAAAAIAGEGERLNQYPPGPGLPALRAAVAADRAQRYGQLLDPDREVLVTVGATEGVAAALLGLLEPGDEVLTLDPCYDSYPPLAALAGARLVRVPLRQSGPAGRFDLDIAAVRAACTPRTRMLLVNSPHNPTGTVLTTEELDALAELCTERDLLAVTDEVYERLTFDSATHVPLALRPGMSARTLSVSSGGKTFSVTGWKVGWVCGPAPLVQAAARVKQFLTFTAGGAFQLALAGALAGEQAWVAEHRARLQAGRDLLVEGLDRLGLQPVRPEGGYFVQADVRPLGFADALAAARALPERAGVAIVPTSALCAEERLCPHLMRLAACKRPEVLAEALERLGAFAARLPRGTGAG